MIRFRKISYSEVTYSVALHVELLLSRPLRADKQRYNAVVAQIEVFLTNLERETSRVVQLIEDAKRRSLFSAPTKATPWTVKDQITHLAYFDEMAELTLTDPDAFDDKIRLDENSATSICESVRLRYSELSNAETQEWFFRSRSSLLSTLSTGQLPRRVSWFGPAMSPISLLVSRTMESWAHGFDIAETTGLQVAESTSLKDVCDIGYRTFANSFITNGLEVPESEVFVILTLPWGEMLRFGHPESLDKVEGPAKDFALVVTQRKSFERTSLVIQGDVAHEWMAVAQCFAGPPGDRRRS